MSKQENRKDALERLFQRKTEEYDISYNENDWLELEDRLDKLDRQHAQRTRRRLIAAAVILAFSILAYFTIENQLQIKKLNDQLSNTQVTRQPGTQQSENGIEKQADSESTVQKGNKAPLEEPSKNQNSNGNFASNQQEEIPNTGTEIAPGNHKETHQTFNRYSLAEKTVKLSTVSPGFDGRYSAITAIKPTKTQTGSTVLAAVSHNEPALVNSRDKIIGRNFPRASLGLVMGPDLSTAGSIANFYDPGYKLGLTFNYNISSNLGIETGIIRTRTRYTAGSNDYRPPEGYLSNNAIPQKTIGDCILLDIPISLKYNFLHFDHSRMYATAGLSSYIMLNEKYRFEYNSYQSGLAGGWSGKTGTSHWLSNASFSVGYELDILPNWSLRAEPFIKVPLKGVGWGNVDLYSMGTIISLNFNINRK